MVPGHKMKIGEQEFIVPPISLGQLRNGLAEKIKQHDDIGADPERGNLDLLPIRAEIVIAALRRNYPESSYPDQFFWDNLDMGNIDEAFAAVINLSGLLGELKAAREKLEAPNGTLDRSIQPSPQLMDGISQ